MGLPQEKGLSPSVFRMFLLSVLLVVPIRLVPPFRFPFSVPRFVRLSVPPSAILSITPSAPLSVHPSVPLAIDGPAQ